jgi:hypothetical protein
MLGYLDYGKGVKSRKSGPLSAKNIMAMHQIYFVQVSINNEDSHVKTSKDKTTTTRPNAPQSTPLEGECMEQMSSDGSELTAHEMYWLMKTSVSTLSASCDHPDDSGIMNPSRLSRDPAEVTGDDKHHPDAPTEPPNMPESTPLEGGVHRTDKQ